MSRRENDRWRTPPGRREPILILLGILPGVIVTTFSTSAFAYLDPGTVTMALQVLVAGIAGLLLFFKLGWTKIKGFFRRFFGSDNS